MLTSQDNDQYFYHTDLVYYKSNLLQSFAEKFATWSLSQSSFFVCNNLDDRNIQKFFVDDFANDLYQTFNGKLFLFKLPPHSVYSWHKDNQSAGTWAFNLTTDNYNSHTLFEIKKENSIHQVIELHYRPNKWTIFNTQKNHIVLNLDNRDRLLLTYRSPSANINYGDVLHWYKQKYVLTS